MCQGGYSSVKPVNVMCQGGFNGRHYVVSSLEAAERHIYKLFYLCLGIVKEVHKQLCCYHRLVRLSIETAIRLPIDNRGTRGPPLVNFNLNCYW